MSFAKIIKGSSLPGSHINQMHGTTVLCVKKNGRVVLIADGQVTFGETRLKVNARKLRRLGTDGKIAAGFAGSTADALTLFERLEDKLQEYPGQLLRSCIALAKSWRTDKYLRQLNAIMIVTNKDNLLTLSGSGDVLEHSDVVAIGSGGNYALAAAKALYEMPDLDAEQIAKKAMTIAADICIYTNHNFTVEMLGGDETVQPVPLLTSNPGPSEPAQEKKEGQVESPAKEEDEVSS